MQQVVKCLSLTEFDCCELGLPNLNVSIPPLDNVYRYVRTLHAILIEGQFNHSIVSSSYHLRENGFGLNESKREEMCGVLTKLSDSRAL